MKLIFLKMESASSPKRSVVGNDGTKFGKFHSVRIGMISAVRPFAGIIANCTCCHYVIPFLVPG